MSDHRETDKQFKYQRKLSRRAELRRLTKKLNESTKYWWERTKLLEKEKSGLWDKKFALDKEVRALEMLNKAFIRRAEQLEAENKSLKTKLGELPKKPWWAWFTCGY
jgi:hypothetical protein